MQYFKHIFFLVLLVIAATAAFSQQDSAVKNTQEQLFSDSSNVVITDSNTKVITSVADTLYKPKHDPRKATFRSAVIPGWGQAYNRQYWKIPIVYGALAIPASFFAYNNKWYHKTRDGYETLVNGGDTASIDPRLKNLESSDLQYYRNYFRKNRDLSVLYFLLAWGLNVADATVFGHLKNFDVSDDLSMSVKPDYNFQSKTPSLAVAFSLNTAKSKALPDFK